GSCPPAARGRAAAPRLCPSALLLLFGEVVERAAAERCKSGAEDQAGVDEFGVRNDALCKNRPCFIQIRLYQRLDHALVVGAWLAFYRLVVFPGVDALGGLAAGLPERHLVQQDLRRLRLM